MLSSGIDFNRVDTTVRPQDDFYRHVNGKWLKEFKLPDDKSRYATFTILREKAREDVKNIIEEAAEKGVPKYMEWRAALGLMVTLVWLYLEILRLLAKLYSRK